MQILSHRGYWKTPEEKNARIAFDRSFALDFGTETDFRDLNGALVIAHDCATTGAMPAAEFFTIFNQYNRGLPLALNVKADGLQTLLQQALVTANIQNYFVFDMSIPDMLGYQKIGIPYYTRQSDIETELVLYKDAAGVWLDSFGSESWIGESTIIPHLAAGKAVCIVSPDLHKRPHTPFWERLKSFSCLQDSRLMLCTDYPEEARAFFADGI
jgi:hypothetical protein